MLCSATSACMKQLQWMTMHARAATTVHSTYNAFVRYNYMSFSSTMHRCMQNNLHLCLSNEDMLQTLINTCILLFNSYIISCCSPPTECPKQGARSVLNITLCLVQWRVQTLPNIKVHPTCIGNLAMLQAAPSQVLTQHLLVSCLLLRKCEAQSQFVHASKH